MFILGLIALILDRNDDVNAIYFGLRSTGVAGMHNNYASSHEWTINIIVGVGTEKESRYPKTKQELIGL